jgi:hypothetical protein
MTEIKEEDFIEDEFVDMFLDVLPDSQNYPKTRDYYVKLYTYLKSREKNDKSNT